MTLIILQQAAKVLAGMPKTEAVIRDLADKLEIAPGIIVGRLQNERVVAMGVGVEQVVEGEL